MKKSIIDKVSSLLINKKWYLVIFLVLFAIFGSIAFKNFAIDNSLEIWFLEDDITLINYNEFKKIYGNDEVILIWVKPETNLYNPDFITKLYDITKKIESHDLIKRVLSIANIPYIDSKEGELIVEDIVEKNPSQGFNVEEYKKRIHSNPLWEKLLLNKDMTATIVMVEPIATHNMDAERPKILSFVKDCFQGLNFKMAGVGVIYEELNRITMRDNGLFTPVAYLVIILLLFLVFRRLSVVLATTLTLILTTTILLEIFFMFKQSLNMISAVLPTLVIIISISDIIHIFMHYEKTPFDKNESRLKRNLNYVIAPCLFTSLTTSIGLLSLATSPMAILRYYGIFAAIGVMIAFFVSVIICSFVLSYVEKRELNKYVEVLKKKDYLDIFLSKLNLFVQKRYVTILIIGFIITIIGFIGVLKLKVDTYSIDFLLDSNKVKINSKFFEKDYGYYTPIEVRIKPKGKDGVKDPEFLKKVVMLQNELDKEKMIEKSTSLIDVVKQLNKVLTDNAEESYKIPDTKEAVAQELLLYEMDKDNDLSYFVTLDYSELRLTVKSPSVSARKVKEITDSIILKANNIFQGSADVILGGYMPLYERLIDYLMKSQIESFLLAFIFIFITMGILFRSFKIILMGIIPNMAPIIFTLGFMGWAKINLDIATVTIAAIAIGIAVDDTIHFIFMYQKARSNNLSIRDSIEETLKISGKAMITTSVLLMIGYLVLTLASIKVVIYFGLLISITMFSALMCDLVLLPSILLVFEKEKK
ncbi:MAG: MMPL family transporter [Desulfobacterales bacterium]|nr:MMPL family transporter [Desulfobacterales bacterium]